MYVCKKCMHFQSHVGQTKAVFDNQGKNAQQCVAFSIEIFIYSKVENVCDKKLKWAFKGGRVQDCQVPKKLKRPNLNIIRFKKVKFWNGKKAIFKENLSKLKKGFSEMLFVLLKFSKYGPKKILFSSRQNKAKIRPKKGQIILFLENCFKKGQIATLVVYACRESLK